MGAMQATVKWLDTLKFVGESESGHSVVMDGTASPSMGVRPMEMLLLGVGGCASIDVVQILKKARQPVVDCRCELQGERKEGEPAPFRKIHMHFVVTGKGISTKHVQRAIELSAEKYCSAAITLAEGKVAISHSFEVVEVE